MNRFVATNRDDQIRIHLNDENQMTNDELNPNDEPRKGSAIISR